MSGGDDHSEHSHRSGCATKNFELGAPHTQAMAQTLQKSVSGLLPYEQSYVKWNDAINAILLEERLFF